MNRQKHRQPSRPGNKSSLLRFAQFGAGRIGAIHADNLAALDSARLLYVVDVNDTAAATLALKYGAAPASVARALADPMVDAVLIASSTDTHADLAIAAAQAGKAIFCEKPIDLSLQRVDRCLAAIRKARVPFFVAFNPPPQPPCRRSSRGKKLEERCRDRECRGSPDRSAARDRS